MKRILLRLLIVLGLVLLDISMGYLIATVFLDTRLPFWDRMFGGCFSFVIGIVVLSFLYAVIWIIDSSINDKI